jgi:Cys-tRNA(Pro) deacylase
LSEKANYPVTPAVRVLRTQKVDFEPHLYQWEEHGGTTRAASELGVEEHAVVKTLLMQTDERKAFIVLMHGDCEVSTKQLARAIGARSVAPCDVATAQKLTGYTVGGISPFGTRARLPVYAETSIFNLPNIYINGGKRGFLVRIRPEDARRVLAAKDVEVAIPV